jgi:hypothetical protein
MRAMSATSVAMSSSTEVCSEYTMLPPRLTELTSPALSSTLRWRDAPAVEAVVTTLLLVELRTPEATASAA